MIEELLNKPYWIVDILPEQAPPERGGQYRRFEEYWLQEPRKSALRGRSADILMKLSCYGGLRVCTPDESRVWEDPEPMQLVSLLTDQELDCLILLEGGRCLITVYRSDTYMTVYAPSGRLLERLKALAASEGLFCWQPPQEAGTGVS